MAGLIVGIREREPSPALTEAIRAGRIAGLLWFRDGLRGDAGEISARMDRLRSLWPPDVAPLFVIDEEGGLIQQLCGVVEAGVGAWPRLPSPRAIGRTGDHALAYAHGREVGRRLRRVGLDATLAPLVDLDPGPASPVLGTRCFGSDPDRVASLALAWSRGLSSAGALGCLKHYPGHGATALDTHRALPRIDAATPMEPHLRPYRAIAASWRTADGPAPGIMTAHLLLAGRRLPASLDPEVLSQRPRGLGPVFTDSLDMGALRAWGDAPERAELASRAGSDFILFGADVDAALAVARTGPRRDEPSLVPWPPALIRPPIPEPVAAESLETIARAALRIIERRPIARGEWTWLLPEEWGAYGEVAAPKPGSRPSGMRWLGRVIRYAAGDPGQPLRAIRAAGSEGPVLLGVIHRGAQDDPGERVAGKHAGRLDAVAYLLDGPVSATRWGIWRAECLGFGEIEIEALRRAWAEEEPLSD